MTEAEFLDALEAWALGGLTDDEQRAMERFLAEHPEHTPAVRRAFTAAAAVGAALPPSTPPAELWQRIVDRLPARPAAPPRRRSTAPLAWALAALAAGVAVWLWLDRGDERRQRRALVARLADQDRTLASAAADAQARHASCVRDLEALRARDALAGEAVALMELAGTQLIPLEPSGGPPAQVAANAIYHRGVKKAYVVVKGLDHDASAYRIWVNRAGHRLPAGELAATDGGSVIAAVAADSLDDVPESFEVTRASGELVLQSHIKI